MDILIMLRLNCSRNNLKPLYEAIRGYRKDVRATTVAELIKREIEDEENKKFKVWVCPSIVYNEHITPNKWEQGILYDKNVNEFFLQKEVKKAYYEMFENSNVLCVIWNNGI